MSYKLDSDDFEFWAPDASLDGNGEWIATLNDSMYARDNGMGGIGFDAPGGGEQGTLRNNPPSGFEQWGPDQYSSIVVLEPVSYGPGVLARGEDTGDDYEVAHTGGGEIEIAEHTSGGWGNLATSSGAGLGLFDTLSIEVEGTAIRGVINGTTQVSTTDGTLTDGSPGIYSYSASPENTATGDDWEAGRLSPNQQLTELREALGMVRHRARRYPVGPGRMTRCFNRRQR